MELFRNNIYVVSRTTVSLFFLTLRTNMSVFLFSFYCFVCFFFTWDVTLQVSIHSVWLGNNITPLREEEWGEDEEDEADTPAPTSPPLSPINSRLVK